MGVCVGGSGQWSYYCGTLINNGNTTNIADWILELTQVCLLNVADRWRRLVLMRDLRFMLVKVFFEINANPFPLIHTTDD